MSRNNKHVNSVKYGICTNMERKPDGAMCSLCQKKEKQAIRSTKDFVCAECGAPLKETTPPPPPPIKLILIISSIVLLAAAVVIGIMQQRNGEEPLPPLDPTDSIIDEQISDTIVPIYDTIHDTVIVTRNDTSFIVVHDTIVDTVYIGKKKASDTHYGTYDLGWGIYEGEIRNGKPVDGNLGQIKVTKEHIIDLKDGRGGSLKVNRGDVFENPKFKDGKWMIKGELHRTDGTRRVL